MKALPFVGVYGPYKRGDSYLVQFKRPGRRGLRQITLQARTESLAYAEAVEWGRKFEAGSLVVLALALSSVPKPAVERTAKLLGLSFEKDYGVEENLAALSALPYLDARRLTLGALMAKEIDNRKEWEAPAPVFDAVMAGVEHELESGRRIAAERAAREAFESDDPERFLAQARSAGAEARRNGAKPEDNPYPKGTVIQDQLCAEWIGGYIHADTEHPAEGIAGSGGSSNVSAETVVPETAEAL